MQTQVEALLRSTLACYQAAVTAMAASSVKAYPHLGQGLQDGLTNLVGRINEFATPGAIQETEGQIEQELKQWAQRAADYFSEKTNEIKEIVALVALTAQSVSERDDRYVGRLNEFTGRLQTIAGLDDLSRIRVSLRQSAAELKSCVASMEKDGQESIKQLKEEISKYQLRAEVAEALASTDDLTGLVNRREVERQIERRIREHGVFCVLMFDLNYFKHINDKYGHLAGDAVLKEFASELRRFFRSTDVIGRWGGDEFVVVMDCALQDAKAKLDRLYEWVFGEYPIVFENQPQKVRVSAAVGLAGWTAGESVTDLIERADRAMYQEKPAARRR
jgi:diguanylate cyclase (GGDEF)-like protein